MDFMHFAGKPHVLVFFAIFLLDLANSDVGFLCFVVLF